MHAGEIRKQAMALRSRGKTVPEISRMLGIARSTAWRWVRDVPLPEGIAAYLATGLERGRERALAVNAARRQRAWNVLSDCAARDVASLWGSDNGAFARVLAAALYWCEGGKRGRRTVMAFTNSDPALMGAFLRAFRVGWDLDERKFRACLHVHGYHDEPVEKEQWSADTGIPVEQFMRSHRKPNTGVRKRSGYRGCLTVHYYDARIAKNIAALYGALAQMGA